VGGPGDMATYFNGEFASLHRVRTTVISAAIVEVQPKRKRDINLQLKSRSSHAWV